MKNLSCSGSGYGDVSEGKLSGLHTLGTCVISTCNIVHLFDAGETPLRQVHCMHTYFRLRSVLLRHSQQPGPRCADKLSLLKILGNVEPSTLLSICMLLLANL